MPWAKLDDRFHENRKVRKAWRRCPAAIGLHVMAITYCAGHLTDGFIDEEFVQERTMTVRLLAQAVGTLVDSGLWTVVDGGWEINDYLEYNPSRAKVEGRRKARSEAGRQGAESRWGEADGMANAMTSAMANADPLLDGVNAPVPTRTQEPSSLRSEAPAAPGPDPLIEELCLLMSDGTRAAHGVAERSSVGRVTKGWRDACRALLSQDGYSVEQVRYAIEWVNRHHYWSKRVRSLPRLRSEMAQVVKEIREQRDGSNVVSIDPAKQAKAEREARGLAAIRRLAEGGDAA